GLRSWSRGAVDEESRGFASTITTEKLDLPLRHPLRWKERWRRCRRSERMTNEAGSRSFHRDCLGDGDADGCGITESGGRFHGRSRVLRAQGPSSPLPALLPMSLDKGEEAARRTATGQPPGRRKGWRQWIADRPWSAE